MPRRGIPVPARLAALLVAALLAACQTGGPERPEAATAPAKAAPAHVARIIPALAATQVVFIGEVHRRYDHHLNQLAIIERLHARRPDLALVLEYFQWPYQDDLDAYVAGEVSEAAMLRATEYFQRWRFDYRLIRPIMRYARRHGIPVVALRMPEEMTERVARGGLAALDSAERSAIGPLERDAPGYRARLQEVYRGHPRRAGAGFERFYETQLMWDEGMAARIAAYLEEHPGRPLVVLTGAGHVAYDTGIPQRLRRRTPVETAVVLHAGSAYGEPRAADFLLRSEARRLPPIARMGVQLLRRDGVVVGKLADDAPARAAGLRHGDRITAAEGEPVHGPEDVWLALLDKAPGDILELEILRYNGAARRVSLEVPLY